VIYPYLFRGGGLEGNCVRGIMSDTIYEVVIIGNAESPEDAARSFLHTTLTHFAEFQIRMLEVVSRGFGITKESLVEAIRDAPEFQKETLEKEVIVAKIVEKGLKTKSGKKVVIKNKV
jgi:hypothetical protein